jgi:Rrf2 family iron-sulfur cluster assembly transcriptional regulator
MTHIARMETAMRVRTRDLSEAINVPAPFLSKIMRRLTTHGILNAQKGHHGGFLLARPPGEVRFIDILRAVDFEPSADHCVFGMDNCDADNPCPLHPEWGVLKGQIEQWARSHTLAELLGERRTA